MSKIKGELFTPKGDSKIIMDTNVLVFVFYPMGDDRRANEYQDLYEKIMKTSAEILVSSIVISEFINRCIRIQYKLYEQVNGELDFKKGYRGTDDYKNNMNAIIEIVKNDILTHAKCIDDKFSEIDTEKIFVKDLEYDFNDMILVEQAKKNNAYLITDDLDFVLIGKGINIVTQNNKILKFN